MRLVSRMVLSLNFFSPGVLVAAFRPAPFQSNDRTLWNLTDHWGRAVGARVIATNIVSNASLDTL